MTEPSNTQLKIDKSNKNDKKNKSDNANQCEKSSTQRVGLTKIDHGDIYGPVRNNIANSIYSSNHGKYFVLSEPPTADSNHDIPSFTTYLDNDLDNLFTQQCLSDKNKE